MPTSAKIYLSLAPCDMRKGFDGLSAQVRNILQLDPFSGAVFLFRGKRGIRRPVRGWLYSAGTNEFSRLCSGCRSRPLLRRGAASQKAARMFIVRLRL